MNGLSYWATSHRRRAQAEVARAASPAMAGPDLSAALLFTAQSTDRALAGWCPPLMIARDEGALRNECRHALGPPAPHDGGPAA